LCLLLGLALPATARDRFPQELDAMCAAQGRTPENPAALAVEADGFGADCALCHDFSGGSFPSSSNVNADGRSFRAGDLDPFCTLVEMNQPPVLEPIENQTVDVGATVAVSVLASDPDGDPLELTVSPLPMGASFVEVQPGEALFTWVPTLDQTGLHTLRFSVSDGLDMDFQDVVVTVGEVNAPPTLAPIGDQQVEVGMTLQLALSASDPEAGVLTFEFAGLPADAIPTDFGDGTAEIAWAPAAAETASVTLTVTDDGTPPESDSETFSLRAVDPGAAGDLTIEKVYWKDRANKLKVKGVSAEPGQTIHVFDADSGALLGSSRGDDEKHRRRHRRSRSRDHSGDDAGRFSLSIRPFVAPCAVQVSADDGPPSLPETVQNAPDDCGERLLTRVRKARWYCRKGELEVKGDRAPIGGLVTIRDADTDALLDEVVADGKGRFRTRVAAAEQPAALAITLMSEGSEWSLEPVSVRGRGCDRPVWDDDDSDDDDHGWDDDDSDGDDDSDDDDGDGGDDDSDDDVVVGN
jgi:hypothetical protein